MAIRPVRTERYFYVNRKGGVNRKVLKHFGDGQPAVTGDYQMFPTVAEFRETYPDMPLRGEEGVTVDPLSMTLPNLESYLSRTESVDNIKRMMRVDDRKGAQELYRERFQELTQDMFEE